jgi:hypothetical protein
MTSYVLGGHSWAEDTVTWSFSGNAVYADEIRRAFDIWDGVIALDFRQARPGETADIEMKFAYIDGSFNTLGEATYWFTLPERNVVAAEIVFDTAENWRLTGQPATSSSVSLSEVALHEIGHVIGLDHASDPDVLMYFSADGSATKPTYWDIFAAQLIYGPEEDGQSVAEIGVFDPLAYIASHNDLIAAFGTDAVAAEAHFWNVGVFEGRDITFSALAYLASHDDLMAVFGADAGAGVLHYIQAGAFEGRQASFDVLEYLASYDDLMAVYGTSEVLGGTHYIASGRFEGRAASFDSLEYIASHADLIAAFGEDGRLGANHFISAGNPEGRTSTFDGLEYIASHGDLIRAFGANSDSGSLHYINRGSVEGRPTDGFDAQQYLSNYTDLAAAFGGDLDAVTQHYIEAGFFEGRVDDFIFV